MSLGEVGITRNHIFVITPVETPVNLWITIDIKGERGGSYPQMYTLLPKFLWITVDSSPSTPPLREEIC